MVMFKDFAFTTLVKKYHLYMNELENKVKMVQKRILSFLFY